MTNGTKEIKDCSRCTRPNTDVSLFEGVCFECVRQLIEASKAGELGSNECVVCGTDCGDSGYNAPSPTGIKVPGSVCSMDCFNRGKGRSVRVVYGDGF